MDVPGREDNKLIAQSRELVRRARQSGREAVRAVERGAALVLAADAVCSIERARNMVRDMRERLTNPQATPPANADLGPPSGDQLNKH
jgi:hypothetical protein